MSERYFDPSIAGLTGEQPENADMNNAANKKDDDVPVLADSDVELISGPKLPELSEEDIAGAIDEKKMKAEGALEKTRAEKAGEMLSKRGAEAVTEMRNIGTQLSGESRETALKVLREKFIRDAKAIDNSKSDAQLNAILDAQLAAAEQTVAATTPKSVEEQKALSEHEETKAERMNRVFQERVTALKAHPQVKAFANQDVKSPQDLIFNVEIVTKQEQLAREIGQEAARNDPEYAALQAPADKRALSELVREYQRVAMQALTDLANERFGITGASESTRNMTEGAPDANPLAGPGMDADIENLFGDAPDPAANQDRLVGEDDVDEMLKDVGT